MSKPDKIYEHESYGVFGISRISGATYLFDSEALHHSYIRLRIAPAKMERHLNSEWIRASGRPYIEIDISYSAFFRGIASPGVGEGVPCTIRSLNGKSLEEPPRPETAESKFSGDIKRTMADATKTLDGLIGQLTEALLPGNKPLNKTELKTLLSGLQSALQGLKMNLPFVETCFNEHMEAKTDNLKTELEGLRDHMLLQLGTMAVAERIRQEGLPEFGANVPELLSEGEEPK